jgi:hypothetical protein
MRLRETLPRLLFESALIVVSILLAFLLNEWRENRVHREAVRVATSNFQAEIEANLESVEAVLPYHRTVVESIRGVLAEPERMRELETVPFLELGEQIMPRGLVPPDLRHTAWETALARGTLAFMSYETISALARAYQTQQHGVGTTWPKITEAVLSPEFFAPGRLEQNLRFFLLAFNELAAQEEMLAAVYRETLASISTAGP